MFKIESDVRKVVRSNFPTAQWVEAGIGGDSGLPDCFINDEEKPGRVWFFELKVGEVSGDYLHYTVRPSQKRRLRLMREAGYKAYILVGEIGTERLWLVFPDKDGRSGCVRVHGERGHVVPILDLKRELLAGRI